MSDAPHGRHLAFPFRIGKDGRTAQPENEGAHALGEIIQLLLTNPGERPLLPSFGGGLRRLVFDRNDEVGAELAKATISDALSRYLGHRVEVEDLDVKPGKEASEESTLTVQLKYLVIETGETRLARFEQGET